MSIKSMAEYIRISKYSRFLPAKNRRETWQEQIERMMGMHKVHLGDKFDLVKEEWQFAKEQLLEKRVLGSQRALQFGGDAILNKHIRQYNCSFAYCEYPKMFQEMTFLNLAGVGVGASVQFEHVAKLPNIQVRNKGKKTFVVQDSIEGWADAVGVLMSSYFANNNPFPEYKGFEVEFDYSLIRKKGAKLSYTGGKAPGPEPLKRALNSIEKMIDERLTNDTCLHPIDCADICCYAADCSVAGGVRRSAIIVLFSKDDNDMMKAKTGSWFIENPQRVRSNNSVVLIRDEVGREEFNEIMKSVKEFGEPGFIFGDHIDFGVNPCFTGDMKLLTKDGYATFESLVDNEVDVVNYKGDVTKGKVWCSGEKEVIALHLHNDKVIKCTPNHVFMLEDGSECQAKNTLGKYLASYEGKDVSVVCIEHLGIEKVYDFSEPVTNWGVVEGVVAHNCVEAGFYARDEYGNAGFQMCNLSEINAKACKTEEQFYDACRASAILGTIQATYTNFPYLGEVTENITKREALLGVSITGMMDNVEISFDPEIQRKGAQVVVDTNTRLANILGINPAARTTCIKPSGTAGTLLGTSSGIHPNHSRRYLRRVRANKNEPTLQFYELYNPKAVEEDHTSLNKTDKVITFLCEVPKNARTKVDTPALELLNYVKLTRNNWVESGKVVERCTKPWINHSVSNTINVKSDEWEEVEDFIFENRYLLTGISLLPQSGDLDYIQAPYCIVKTTDEILKTYGEGSMLASGVIVNATRVFNDNLWAACDCVLGIGEKLDVLNVEGMSTEVALVYIKEQHEKKMWVERAKKFADNYFNGDIRKMTYCLKDVNNFKTWVDIERTHEEVPWELLFESEDNTKVEQSAACAGGKCDL